MSDDAASRNPSRTPVVQAALDLFAQHGYDLTSVEQIAQAAGVSRSTFFRQFGGKEDVVFADHELVLADLKEWFARGLSTKDPWQAAAEASIHVFEHFAHDPEFARRRYQVVRQVKALREREIVMTSRYERLFTEYLREALPGIDPVDAVGFAALVTAIHNHLLRRMLRGHRVTSATLRQALDDALRRFGVLDASPAGDDVVVAVFPRAMPVAEVARRLRDQLDG